MLESRSSLASLSGARITSVEVVTEGPELPGLTHLGAPLHPVSRETTVRRQLLFAPGDTVDTLMIGETMRRLRRQRTFTDAVLLARQCGDSAGVGLVLRTRDSWTLRPTARLRSASSLSLGIEERNLLGTGRTISLTSEMSNRGPGAAVSLTDPWVLGSDLSANLRFAKLGDSHTFRAGARNHEYSVFDPWRVEANLARLSFGDTAATDRSLHTVSAMALIGRRVGSTSSSSRMVTMLVVGAEFDSAASISTSRTLPTGAPPQTPHVRSFLGVDLGMMRRTAQYDTASWVVPGSGFLDIPIGWEGDVVAAGGYERSVHQPAGKVDAWLGRVWIPARGRVLMLDLWGSGYLGKYVDANHIARASAGWYEEAPRGMWGARLSFERLLEVDPDLRALSLMPLADYTTPVVRPYAARGERTIAASVERSIHLFTIGTTSVVDAGPFLAASFRRGVDSVADNQLRAGVVGTRFRILTANGAVSSARIDIGYPVVRSASLSARPFLVLTMGTLFDVSRQRDGRRVY
jgi:hypothetical protein